MARERVRLSPALQNRISIGYINRRMGREPGTSTTSSSTQSDEQVDSEDEVESGEIVESEAVVVIEELPEIDMISFEEDVGDIDFTEAMIEDIHNDSP